jgi:hypothetical protein
MNPLRLIIYLLKRPSLYFSVSNIEQLHTHPPYFKFFVYACRYIARHHYVCARCTKVGFPNASKHSEVADTHAKFFVIGIHQIYLCHVNFFAWCYPHYLYFLCSLYMPTTDILMNK